MLKTRRRITNTVRALRFAHQGMTQAVLAERVRVTRQTIIAIEQERYTPSLEVAFRIARAFGKPLEEVFHYPDDDPNNAHHPTTPTHTVPNPTLPLQAEPPSPGTQTPEISKPATE